LHQGHLLKGWVCGLEAFKEVYGLFILMILVKAHSFVEKSVRVRCLLQCLIIGKRQGATEAEQQNQTNPAKFQKPGEPVFKNMRLASF
jgi:hypothetical protein